LRQRRKASSFSKADCPLLDGNSDVDFIKQGVRSALPGTNYRALWDAMPPKRRIAASTVVKSEFEKNTPHKFKVVADLE
jgi:hypothetical protein